MYRRFPLYLAGFFVVASALAVRCVYAQDERFDPGLAEFAISLQGQEISYRVFFAPVLPETQLTVRIVDPGGHRFKLSGERAGPAIEFDDGAAVWRAPAASGHYPLIVERDDGAVIRIQAFVMVPVGKMEGEYLKGYRIGNYPDRPLRGLAIYARPAGFIEVTQDLHALPISPHFTLGQFLAKQKSGWPKFMALRPHLLLKLEGILKAVNEHGWRTDSLHVMSGYRTPFYNRAIGNVPYSRHLWGGAADIFIDRAPRDGIMDDLDGDGRSTAADAVVLAQFISGLRDRAFFQPLTGGLAAYDSTSAHGPFVHVDVRGWHVRWGRR